MDKEHLVSAEILAFRNKKRLNESRDLKKQEVDMLFFWAINRLEWSMNNCSPAEESYNVELVVEKIFDDGRILLRHAQMSLYLSQYVKKDDFFAVMEEVADIFNEIGKNEEKDYHFYATYVSEEKIVIHMHTGRN